MMVMKNCTKCGVEKPLSAFYKHRLSKDGHAGEHSSDHKDYQFDGQACIIPQTLHPPHTSRTRPLVDTIADRLDNDWFAPH